MININEVELSRQILSENLSLNPSPRRTVYLLNNYFTYLLNLDNIQIFEAFGFEFLDIYSKAWEQYDPVGVVPSFSNSMIFTGEGLLDKGLLENNSSLLKSYLTNQKIQLEKLDNSLQGLVPDSKGKSNLSFPVLENKIGDEIVSGYIEEIDIVISANKESNINKFILVPGGIGNADKLKNQINISWDYALKYCGKYLEEINNTHKVIIHFSMETAFYVGDSIGIALTLKFIEELLKYYNSRWIITFPAGISFSGGIDVNGDIGVLGEENIREKVEVLFFSNANTLVVPEQEENTALQKLSELKSTYPKRRLGIWGINSIDEILNRRDLVDIQSTKNTGITKKLS